MPVVFVCENNGYARGDPVAYHCSSRHRERAGSYDMPGIVVDGLDLFSVYEAAGEAIARARRGEGRPSSRPRPTASMATSRATRITYRPTTELSRFKLRDPILGVRSTALDAGLMTADEFDAIDARRP
jgi:pyruvate dehydrogenase E1 component alpha subunit